MSATRISQDDLAELEREWVGRARGRVLELGAGDGQNFGAFSPDIEWSGIEPDDKRRAELAQRAREWGHTSAPIDAVGERMPVPTASVDALVATYVLCSVTDVAQVLAEARRVLVPGGRVLFIDHVVAPEGTVRRGLQRAMTPLSARFCHGCHWDRDPSRELERAGFAHLEMRRVEVRAVPGLAVPVLLYDGRA